MLKCTSFLYNTTFQDQVGRENGCYRLTGSKVNETSLLVSFSLTYHPPGGPKANEASLFASLSLTYYPPGCQKSQRRSKFPACFVDAGTKIRIEIAHISHAPLRTSCSGAGLCAKKAPEASRRPLSGGSGNFRVFHSFAIEGIFQITCFLLFSCGAFQRWHLPCRGSADK